MNNYKIGTALVALCCLSVLSTVGFAAGSLKAKSVLANKGDVVSVPIELDNAGLGVVGLQLDIDYNPQLVNPGSAKAGAAQGTRPFFSQNLASGKSRLLVGSDQTLSVIVPGQIATIPFTVTSVGSKIIAPSNVVAADQTPAALPYTVKPGLIADAADGFTDTDRDGIPDSWEVAHGLDPLDPRDAQGDLDGDGIKNIDEYKNGKSPNSASTDSQLAKTLYAWTKTFPGNGSAKAKDVAIAPNGAAYIVGDYSQLTDFDPSLAGEDIRSSDGWMTNLFITKLNGDGSYGWTRTVSSTAWTWARAVAVDANGNAYITGTLTGYVQMGAETPIDASYAHPGLVFLMRINAQGSVDWIRTVGSVDKGGGEGYAVEVDANGFIYMAGTFVGSVDFDPDPTKEVVFVAGAKQFPNQPTSFVGMGAFLSKYSADGLHSWTRAVVKPVPDATSNGNAAIRDVAIKGEFIAVAGTFWGGSIDFNPDPSISELKTTSTSDGFIAVYKTDGTYFGPTAQLKAANTSSSIYPYSVAFDSGSNIYVAGTAKGSIDFDPSDLTLTKSTISSSDDGFLIKLNLNNQFEWVKLYGTTNVDSVSAVKIDALDNVYLSGTFRGAIDFDPADAALGARTSGNDSSAFVLQTDTNGAYRGTWVTAAGPANGAAGCYALYEGWNSASVCGATSPAMAFALALDSSGSLFIAGQFAASVEFNPEGAGDVHVSDMYDATNRSFDMFLTKFSRITKTTNTLPVGNAAAYTVDIRGQLAGTLNGSDADAHPLTFALASNGAKGSATVTSAETGQFLYTPNGSATGRDTFTFTVNDGYDTSAPATITVAITSAHDTDGDGMLDEWETQNFGTLARDDTTDYDLDGLTDLQEFSASTNPLIADNGKTIPNHGYLWTHTFGQSRYEFSMDVASDAAGNAYVTGYFYDPDTGLDNAFVKKVTTSGNTEWTWEPVTSAQGKAIAYSLAVTANGEVYVTGYASGKVDFGAAAEEKLNSTTKYVFLTKIVNGTAISTKLIGSIDGSGEGRGLAITTTGDVYLAGTFGGTADFDPSAAVDTQIAGQKLNDRTAVFVTKFNADSSYGWTRFAKPATTTNGGYGYGVAVDANNVYVTGQFFGTFDFDGVANSGEELVSVRTSGYDGFVAKWSAQGVFVNNWQFHGLDSDSSITPRDLILDASSNIYVTGQFKKQVDFDPSASVASQNLRAATAQSDMFVTKLLASGQYAWTETLGNSSNASYSSSGTGLAVYGDKLYVAGYFSGSVDFDPTAGTDVRATGDAYTQFVSAYKKDNASAMYLGAWSPVGAFGRFFGTPYINNGGYGYGVAVSGQTLYLAGNFVGTLNFNTTGLADVRSSVFKPDGMPSNDGFITALQAPPLNQAPVAVNATISVVSGTTVTGTLQASDPNGDTLAFTRVTQPTKGSLVVNATTGVFSYSSSAGATGSDSFTFKVSDSQLDSNVATVTINFSNAPILSAIGNKSIVEGSALSFTVSASDADGTKPVLSASGLPAGATFDSTSGAFNWTPGPGSAGSYSVTFMATDAADNTLQDQEIVLISVTAPATGVQSFVQDNSADGIISIEAEHLDGKVARSAHDWTQTTLNAGYSGTAAMDAAPNTTKTYNTGYETTSAEMKYVINFTKTGVHYVWLRGWAPSGSDDSVHVGLNGMPLASSDKMSGFNASWRWSKNTMDGVVSTIDITTPGIHTLNVWIREDGYILDKIVLTTSSAYNPGSVSAQGPAESQRTATSSTNQAPVLNAIGNKSVVENTLLQFAVVATDADGTAVSYEVTGLPAGATFNSTSGEFSWTPVSNTTGSYQVTFTAKDAVDPQLLDSETITIKVTAPNRAPILNAIGNKSVVEGGALSFTVSASDADGTTPTLSVSSLPTGATFDSTTGAFSWTPGPGSAGSYTVTFTATDAVDSTLKSSESVTIAVTAPNRVPVLNAIGNKSVVEGSALSFTISASDADGTTPVLSASGLPAGATFDTTTGAFSWTPGPGSAGSYAVTFTATDQTDGTLKAEELITITVDAPAVNNDTDADGLPDSWEQQYFGSLSRDGLGDYDGDGVSDTQEFSRNTLPDVNNVDGMLKQARWMLKFVDSEELVGENAPGTNAFDGNTTTFWHSQWQSAAPVHPHEIQIDLANSYVLKGFRYLPRQDGITTGTVKGYEFYVSEDGVNWDTAVASGNFAADTTEKTVSFSTKTGRYIRFVANSEIYGTVLTSMAELGVIAQAQLPATMNQLPAISGAIDKQVKEGATLSFTVVATDSDGGTPKFGAFNLPAGATFDTQTGAFSWTPGAGSAGVYYLTFVADDPVDTLMRVEQRIMVIVSASGLAFVPQSGPDNVVSMEAENYDSKVARSSVDWTINTTIGFSGSSAISAQPNTGKVIDKAYATTSPQLSYLVNFTQPGLYHVWVRGLAPSTGDNSVHLGLDGVPLVTSDKLSGFTTSWKWTKSTADGVTASVYVEKPGIHVINVWMRKDGFILDKLVLTTNSVFNPGTATGPTESARANW